MAIVWVFLDTLYKRTHSLSRMTWSWVCGRLAPFYIHQMNRVNSHKGLCHDDNTINNIVLTLIITITYSRVLQPKYTNTTQYGQKYSRSGFVRGVHSRTLTNTVI